MNMTLDDALTTLEEAGIECTLVIPGMYCLGDNSHVTFSNIQIVAIAEAVQLTM